MSQTLTAASRDKSGPSVLKAAGLMGAATFLSRILGLVREQAFAFLFGAGNATDAFNVAFRIPNLLRDLFAEGAMSASLVPVFTRSRIEEGDRRAWRVAGLVFRVLFAVVGVLALIGIVFAPQLVDLYAGAFKEIPGKFDLAVRMTRIMFPFFPLVAIAAAFMGILNACGVFFMPAFSSALFNVGSITVGVALAVIFTRYGGMQPIEGMAIGVLFGGAVQAFSQLPALYRSGYRWQKKLPSDPAWYRDPALIRMLWMMVPGTVGLAATQVNLLVNTILATSQGAGAVSWLNYAFRLMQFPIGVFGVALASATLPRVSQLWVRRDIAGVGDTLTRSLRQVFAINLPASAGLAFLGYPIIELIYQYGRFSPEDTRQTALALAMYAVGLTAYSAVKVLVPACYAMGDTRIPVLSSLLAVFSTVVLNVLMVRELGFWSLALGTSLGATVNGLFLLFAVRNRMNRADQAHSFRLLPVFKAFFQHLLVALLMGLGCYYSHRGLSLILPDSALMALLGPFAGKVALPLVRLLKTGLIIGEGVLLIVFLAYVFRLRDTTEVIELFTHKIKKKLSHKRS